MEKIIEVIETSIYHSEVRYEILRDISPRPLLNVKISEEIQGNESPLHFFIYCVSEVGYSKRKSEQTLFGVPDLDLVVSADTGKPLGFECVIGFDRLSTIEQSLIDNTSDVNSGSLIINTNQMKLDSEQILKIAAPLKFYVSDDRLFIVWGVVTNNSSTFGSGAKLNYIVNENDALIGLILESIGSSVLSINSEM